VEQSGTPYFCFKDLDENKPASSIKIRVETIDYFLQRYGDDLRRKKRLEAEIETRLGQYERCLREAPRGPACV
jgi:predicted nucleotide-binding protein (sugar kinase/HSP70/actin superfamily)